MRRLPSAMFRSVCRTGSNNAACPLRYQVDAVRQVGVVGLGKQLEVDAAGKQCNKLTSVLLGACAPPPATAGASSAKPFLAIVIEPTTGGASWATSAQLTAHVL